MRQHVLPLFAANGVAFASVGFSYFMYSRLLSVSEFGAYSAALAVGNLAVLVLDGGIRTSIIKHRTSLAADEESALLTLMLAFSALLLAAVLVFKRAVVHYYPAASNQTGFVAAFAAVYLVTYPWIGLSTAAMERELSYSRLAWIESIGNVLERASPVGFILLAGLRLESFVAGLALGRICRVLLLASNHPVKVGWKSTQSSGVIRNLLQEGLWFQTGGMASLVRDTCT